MERFWGYFVSVIWISLISCTSSLSIKDHNYGDALPNSCIDLSDGDYWLQLSMSDSSYMPVYLTCNNEYIMLDISKDNDLVNYFTSFEMFNDNYQLGGPSIDNIVNWQEWFLNDNFNENSNYLISPNCDICNENDIGNVYNSDTTYWMNNEFITNNIKYNQCKMNENTYQCYDCQNCLLTDNSDNSDNSECDAIAYNKDSKNFETSGMCGITKQESGKIVNNNNNEYKPSIGTNGQFCVCYKPDISRKRMYLLTSEQETEIEIKIEKLINLEKENVFVLSKDNDDGNNDDANLGKKVSKVGENVDIVGVTHKASTDTESDDNSSDITNDNSGSSNPSMSSNTKTYHISGILIFIIIVVSIGGMLIIHFINTRCCMNNNRNNRNNGNNNNNSSYMGQSRNPYEPEYTLIADDSGIINQENGNNNNTNNNNINDNSNYNIEPALYGSV